MSSENKVCPPQPAPTEYPYKRPEQLCIEDYKSTIFLAKAWTAGAVVMIFISLASWLFVPDPRLDPKRTDHAVEAGIRECERTLPRTQTCELSQLSFKVVEKKTW